MTSEALAACLQTNPVVVRRTLAGLRDAGFLRSQKGRGGGWSIACDLEAVSLLDVHAAVGSPALLAFGHSHGPTGCLVEQAVRAALDPAFRDAEAQLQARLAAVSIAQLAEDFGQRFAARTRQSPPPQP